MAKFGGFPGGMGNMQNMIKQAQKMQKDMQEKQQEVRKLVNDYSIDIISINKVLYKTSIEEGYQVSKIFCTKI